MATRSWNYSTLSRRDYGTVSSERTPGYHALRSQGKLLPGHPYKKVELYGSAPFGKLPTSQGSLNMSYFTRVPDASLDMYEILYDTNGTGQARPVTINNGNLPQKPGNQVTWRDNMTIQRVSIDAQNKLVKKLNNRDIDLGVALGEARETAAFVQSACLRLYRAYHAARRGNLSGLVSALGLTKSPKPSKQRGRDVPDAAAGVWLEYSYAVRPLLADVYGAMSALEKRHQRPTIVERQARSSHEYDAAIATSGVSAGGCDYEWAFRGTLTARHVISFEIANPFTYSLSQLGLTNPLNVAWELVPFSFVVDWFIPIGSFFDGLVPPQGISNIMGASSFTGSFEGRGRLKWNFPVPPNTKDGVSEHFGSWTSRFKGRSPFTSYPRYHLVGATFDLSKEQVASGIALLWSVGAGRKAEHSALGNVKESMGSNARKFPEEYWRV